MELKEQFEIPELELPVIDSTELEQIENVEEGGELEETPEIVSDPKAVAYFEELKQRGYVDENTEFKGTWEELDQYFDSLPQQILNSVVESYPEVSKDVLKYIATAGENLTKDEMKKFFETYFEEQDVKEKSIETMDDARTFLYDHYKSLGIKEKSIDVILDGLEDDDELLNKAKEINDSKQKESKTEKLIDQKKQENQRVSEEYKEKVKLIQEEINSTGWKKEKIERVSQLLSNQNINTVLKDVFSNPKSIVQLADFLDLYDSKSKTFNLEPYKKQGEAKSVKGLKERLENENFNSLSTSTKHRDANPNSDIDQFKGLVPVI